MGMTPVQPFAIDSRSYPISHARYHSPIHLVGFAQDYFGSSEGGLISRVRQRQLLQETAASLQRSIGAAGEGEELAAEELRVAASCLGRLLGRVDVEDVLDVIFREFCVGK